MHVASERVMNLMKWLISKSKRQPQQKFIKEKTVKILCMGRKGVGKTSVIHKLCDKDYCEDYSPTVYDDHLKEIGVDEYKVSLQFMDMGGSQHFPSMQQVFIRQADIYIIFYAVNDLASFNEMLEYRDNIAAVKGKHYTELPLLIVRNKLDLKEKRLKKEVQRRKTLNQWCGKIYDVSAKTGIKINSIMDSLIEESKFVENDEIDPEKMKISGRYLYQDHNGKRELTASEMYHKAPNMFGEKDNSEEKMEKRRRRSLQQPSRKMSRTLGKSGTIARRRSLGSTFRRKAKDTNEPEKPLWMTQAESQDESPAVGDGRSTDPDGQPNGSPLKRHSPSVGKSSFDRVNSNGSNESVRTPSAAPKSPENDTSKATKKSSPVINKNEAKPPMLNHKHSLDHQLITLSQKKKSVEQKFSLDEQAEHAPSSPFFRPRLRKKSLSHTDINLLVPDTRLRSASMNSPSFMQKMSALRDRTPSFNFGHRQNKPARPEIVHTTLKTGDEETPVVTFRKSTRSFSTTSRDSRDSRDSISKSLRNSTTGRKISLSIDCISDSEQEMISQSPPPQRLRRRSLSQNDLSTSIQGFNMNRLNEDFHEKRTDAAPKKAAKSSSTESDTTVRTLPHVSGLSGMRRQHSVSLYRKKAPAQHVINEHDEEESERPPVRRKLSNSTPDILISFESKPKGGARPKSFDENKNIIVWKKTKRPPLKKGTSFDFQNSSPPRL